MGVSVREAFLQQEGRDEALARVRLIAPIMAVLVVAGIALSPTIGVSVTPSVLGINAITIVVALALSGLSRAGRLPPASLHVASAVTWLLLPTTTLATLAVTGASGLVVPLIGALFAAPLMMVSRLAILATTSLAACWWWQVAPASDESVSLELARVAVLGSLVIANVAGYFSTRAFRAGAALRADLRAMNARLQQELQQRLATEDERETYRDQFIAAQRSEAIGSLAAGLAHEMNNILAGVLTSAELLADEAPDDETASAASTIAKEAQRGGALTQSLLAFARRGKYQRAPLRLDEMVDEVRRVLPRTLRRTITLQHHYASDAVVDVDRAQLIQAILNLGINGADAMPNGGVLTLRTECERLGPHDAQRLGLQEGVYAVVSVSDTGHGMDPETRQRAFEPFYTTKPVGKGTGLGLAMVEGSVRAHGGSLEVQSVVDQGTTVRLLLPVHGGPATRAAAKAERDEQRCGQVLVVDDEPLVRSTLARLLERVGLQVIGARDGAEGLAKFARHDGIMLVVCDLNMPVMDGAAFVRALQNIRRLPVILVSGYAVESEARELIASGLADRFVEKPFTRRSLLDAIDGVLSHEADSGKSARRVVQ